MTFLYFFGASLAGFPEAFDDGFSEFFGFWGESSISSILGFAKTDVFGCTGCLGASLGAVRTFHSGLTVYFLSILLINLRERKAAPQKKISSPLGAPFDLDAVRLTTSSLKKISNEILGILGEGCYRTSSIKDSGFVECSYTLIVWLKTIRQVCFQVLDDG